jgi:hypothetical protein
MVGLVAAVSIWKSARPIGITGTDAQIKSGDGDDVRGVIPGRFRPGRTVASILDVMAGLVPAIPMP